MTSASISPAEASIAGLLHDIGKLAQRAHPNEEALRRAYAEAGRDLAGTEAAILPLKARGQYSHRHALWTDFAFLHSERARHRWPDGLDPERIKAVAVRHHNPRPDDSGDWIIAEADRLASGLERKERDEAEEARLSAEEKATGFREVELVALLPRIELGTNKGKTVCFRHPAEELSADTIMPARPAPADQPRRFGMLWDAWVRGFDAIARHALSAERFELAVLGLSERLLWAVPSSTVDQPDISLHDHARAVGAIAAALAAWHEAAGAWTVQSVKDRDTPKFRLVIVDLSGIQAALLRLASQKAASRVLRGRSFLIAETVSAAVVDLRRRLGLPASSVLLDAAGKAELLAPALPDLDARLEEARAALDSWMVRHWQGDLALVLAAGPAFPARAFMQRGAGLAEARAALARALDDAKHRPFSAWRGGQGLVGTGVIDAPFGADGACVTCGVRPAVTVSDLDGEKRCIVCDDSQALGQRLTHAHGYALVSEAESGASLPGGLCLLARDERGESAVRSVAFEAPDAEIGSAVPRPRAHVPVIGDPSSPRYRDIEETAERGELMTFAHIAAESLEEDGKRGFRGRALLGILKADVDRLGQVFRKGLGDDRSPARIATLSRMLDQYFSRRLPWLLEREFPAIYTVYAGGDDLLLVAPWRFAAPLALRLRDDFSAFTGGNTDLTLSAGIAFVHPKHPLALAVEEAEEALQTAKRSGRDRIGLFGRTLAWPRLRATLDLAEALTLAQRRENGLPSSLLHRMRRFAADRARAEAGEAGRAGWNAKWRYHEARYLHRADSANREADRLLLASCLPPPGQQAEADAELAITIALWRNR